jgi:HEAT repeat protein
VAVLGAFLVVLGSLLPTLRDPVTGRPLAAWTPSTLPGLFVLLGLILGTATLALVLQRDWRRAHGLALATGALLFVVGFFAVAARLANPDIGLGFALLGAFTALAGIDSRRRDQTGVTVLEELRSPDAGIRRKAIRSLATGRDLAGIDGGAASIAALLAIAADPVARADALRVIGSLLEIEAVPWERADALARSLAGYVRDPHPEVREAALEALGGPFLGILGPETAPAVVEDLLAALHDATPSVQAVASRTLAQGNYPASLATRVEAALAEFGTRA